MSTSYDPTTALWAEYDLPAPLRFTARTPAAGRSWQQRTRRALAQSIGFQTTTPVVRARRLSSVAADGFIRERHELTTARGVRMPFYLLLPSGPGRVQADEQGRRPVVIAAHGHGQGADEIVGMWPDGSERNAAEGYQQDFARTLVRQGFIVAVPEIAGFGSRSARPSALGPESPRPGSCQHLATLAWHLGGSPIGFRVRDTRRLIDHLTGHPAIDARRIGMMGISGGGMLSLFTAALEPRIRALVVSGYFSSFRESVLSISHCWCNFVPGMHRFGEMHDLAALVAPRPLLIEAGLHDEIFPIQAVRAGLVQARAHYRVFKAEGAVEDDIFEGRHRIHGARAYAFLAESLAQDGRVGED